MSSKALLIAEKPDLMRKLEEVYKAHRSEIPYEVTFTSQRGHLVTLMMPDEIDPAMKEWSWDTLPFHPEDHGGWKYKVIQEKKQGHYLTSKERFDSIKKEIHSGAYDFIINAGDPDQEGELLIRLVLHMAGNKLPIKRFWSNDLTEKAVLDSFKDLRDDNKDPMLVNLLKAAYGRQHSDYRFGMNITRAASLQMNARVACGRVKTPILAIVCRREDEIRNFKPSTTYGVKAVYGGESSFEGTLFDPADATDGKDEGEDTEKKTGIIWFDTKKEADDLILSLPDTASVISFEKKRATSYAPKLYKLASAQVDAGKMGYNDARTLEIIQGLYEKEYLSYPRTDCEYLSSKEDFIGILKAVMAVPEFEPYIRTINRAAIEKVRKTKKWINDKALQDAGHSALRPTTKAVNFESLSKEEQDIYSMICRRFVAIFLPPLLQDETMMVTKAGDSYFRSSGKTLVDPGYTKIFGTEFNDMLIPQKAKGEILPVQRYEHTEKTTTCPRRFTSPELIQVCENPAKYLNDMSLKALGKRLKIGTSATRSGIIRQLIEVDKYLEEKKVRKTAYVSPTPAGEAIIRNLGDCDICKVDMTGEWEEKLEMVRTGSLEYRDFENLMRSSVESMVLNIKGTKMKQIGKAKYAVIGKCPYCGKDLCEGGKGFFCMGFRDDPKCNINAFKDLPGYDLTKEDFLELIGHKTITRTLEKNGRRWEQAIRYDFDNYRVVFDNGEAKELCPCPVCGGTILADDRVYYCSNKASGKCKVSAGRSILGADITEDEFKLLLGGGMVEKRLSKSGKAWQQQLVLDLEDGGYEFYEPDSKADEHRDLSGKCPKCKVKMKRGAKGWECTNKCGLRIPYELWERPITEEEAETLLKKKKTELLEGFISSKTGKPFPAVLAIKGTKVEPVFPKRK